MNSLVPIHSTEGLVLVGTLNGTLHCVSTRQKTVLWSTKEFFPETELSLVGPEYFVEPLQHGGIYRRVDRLSFERLPFTVEQLLLFSPLRTDKTVCLGRKETDIVEIDLDTGEQSGVFTVDSAGTNRLKNRRSVFVGRRRNIVTICETEPGSAPSTCSYTRLIGQLPVEKTRPDLSSEDLSFLLALFGCEYPTAFFCCLNTQNGILLGEFDPFGQREKRKLLSNTNGNLFIFPAISSLLPKHTPIEIAEPSSQSRKYSALHSAEQLRFLEGSTKEPQNSFAGLVLLAAASLLFFLLYVLKRKNKRKIKHTKEVLGVGQSGNTVYRGFFEGREVAVKRMPRESRERAERE
ncbi:MAG: uncharacterized protein A8A55_2077, partial [Amphiamblys sp. WSBS2006]